jgi:hypothetical protein
MSNIWLVLHAATLALGTTSLSVAQSAAAPRDVFVRVSPEVQIHVRMAGPANAKHPLVLIPGWRLTAGHAVFVDQPERFDRLLADLLAQTES